MRKILGFAVLFALGFATGAYVLNTYFPHRGGPTQVAVPGGDTEASRVELTRSLEQRSAVPEPAPTNFETMLRIAAQRIAPAVVNIDTTARVRAWGGGIREVPVGSGSGVIISPDGYVVTNNHVVRVNNDSLASQIWVTMRDGRRLPARVLGTDRRNDLALLKVDERNLPAAPLGDSDKLQVGDWVIAVGNPFGLGTTVTAGIVSAIDRRIERQDMPGGMIQTDAAINAGNSGGALADSRGRLVGINTAIFSPVGANVGIGFAIPVNRVKQVVREILQYGSLGEAYLGIGYGDVSDPRVQQLLKRAYPDMTIPQQGIIIGEVDPVSGAARAGLQPDDIITHIDGRPIRTIEEVQNILRLKKPGDRVQLRIWREGRTLQVEAILGRVPSRGF